MRTRRLRMGHLRTIISQNQKKNLFVRMSELNIRQSEPEPIDLESPGNLSRMFSTLTDSLSFSFQEMCELLAWNEREIRDLLPVKGPEPIRRLRVV